MNLLLVWTFLLLQGLHALTVYPFCRQSPASHRCITNLRAAVSSEASSVDIDDEGIDFDELVDAIMEDDPSLLLEEMGEDFEFSEEDMYEDDDESEEEKGETDEEDEPVASEDENDNTPTASMTEEEELQDFLEMLEESPVGTLEDVDDLAMLRDSIATILESLSTEKTITVKTAETAEQLLFRMTEEWQTARSEKLPANKLILLEPTSDDFLRAIKTWAAAAGVGNKNERLNTNVLPEVASHVIKLFRFQMDLYNEGLESVEPDYEIYETVLQVLSNSRERGMDRKLFSIFEQAHVKTAKMYQLVIPSLAKSRDRGAADRAEKLLREAVEQHPPTKINGKRSGMTIDTFNGVLTAWAKSGLPYGPERAEKLIMFMDQIDNENGGHGIVKPNIFSFTSLIDAYAQQTDWDSAAQSERILRRLLEQYLSGEEGIPEPSVASWTIAISAWARLSKKGFKGAALRAGKLLNYMEDLHDDGKIGFGPDAIVYVTCMNAYAFSKIVEAPTKAEEILDLTNELYLEGDETMKPSAKSIRIVLDSWIRSNSTDAMEEAELLLERYEDHLDSLGPPEEPVEVFEDVRDIYRTMLFGFAKKGSPVQAKHYLDVMIQKGMKPDCFCYDKIIEANALLNDEGSYQRSYEVFQLMEARRQMGEVNPNERVYTSFIRAMTKGLIPNLAHKANVMLRRMNDLYELGNKGIRPTVFTYNAVLMACAETPSTPDAQPMNAFKIAVQVFNDLRNEKEEPDHVSYGNMLRCARLLPDGDQKDNVIKSTFALCAKAGFVNAFVVRDLQAAASEELWRSLLETPDGEVDAEYLPREWRYRFEKRKRPSSPPSSFGRKRRF